MSVSPDHPSTPATGALLREPAHRVSTRAPVLWAASAAAQVAFVLVGLVVVEAMDWWDVPLWIWPAYAVVALAYVVAMPLVRYRIHRWETTETAVYTQTGWLSRELRIAPMSRVQTVDFDQSAVARLFSLASVSVTTASAAGPLHINGIEVGTARRLVEDLTRRAEAEAGDAT